MNGELKPWTVHGQRSLYESPWVHLKMMDVEPPGVARFEHHVVELQHVSIAAVVNDRDEVLMLWRYRFVPDEWGYELPGGIVEKGEDPADTAARETEEETGWRPDRMVKLTSFQPMIGMVDSPHDLYMARGAQHVGAPSDVEESGRVEWVPLSRVGALLSDGKLLGSGTLVGLLHILAFTRAS